jgi:transcriptional regulator with XRE-family HTH domain
MTQAALARQIETGERNVQRWEGGENEPRIAQLVRIAYVTGQPLEFFIAAAVTA